MIKVYEDLNATTDLTENEQDNYIKFIQDNLDEEYPHLDIQVINGPSLDKVVNDDYNTYQDEEIEISVAAMWELWEKR